MLVFIVFSTMLFGQPFEVAGILPSGAGFASSFNTVNPSYSNPASFCNAPDFVSASASQIWWIKEYSVYTISSSFNVSKFGIGLQAGYFGKPSLYSEELLVLRLAHKLGKIGSLGARLKFLGEKYPEEKQTMKPLVDLGFIHDLSNYASVGIFVQDAPLSKSASKEVQFKISIGGFYEVSNWAKALMDIKFVGEKAYLYLGQSIMLGSNLCIGIGVGSRPMKMFFGAKFSVKNLSFAISGQVHPELGVTNDFGIVYEFRESK